MDQQLRDLITRFTGELRTWLDRPSEATKQLETLRSQIETLKGQLRGQGMAEMRKGLQTAEKSAQRLKQRQAAEAIATLCKPLGVILEPKEPPRRKTTPKKT